MEQPTADDTQWPHACPTCSTELQRGVIDFDKTNRNSVELHPGEMVMVDFCPNPDCPDHGREPQAPDEVAAPE